ncbi:MAG: ABC transporter substrate-binding protein [Chitinivibrionales bacterium]|nr:ABC transporter substrate-binding protein [Chitinivibrionales bacterium]
MNYNHKDPGPSMYTFLSIFFPLFFLVISGCSDVEMEPPDPGSTPERIVSLAPNITETLFALGCGDKVVGVSQFCSYPPHVRSLPKVGGFTNPNFEALMRLKPDLVVLMKEHGKVIDFCTRYKVPFLRVDNDNIATILNSFEAVGTRCGATKRADSLINHISSVINDTIVSKYRPRILLCVDRSAPGSGTISKPFFAGASSFYSDLLNAAGGENACTENILYPTLSIEGVCSINPDIIIDIVPEQVGMSQETIVNDWNSVPLLDAVDKGMVFCLKKDYIAIPGPRIGKTIERFRALVRICLNTGKSHKSIETVTKKVH